MGAGFPPIYSLIMVYMMGPDICQFIPSLNMILEFPKLNIFAFKLKAGAGTLLLPFRQTWDFGFFPFLHALPRMPPLEFPALWEVVQD